MSQTAYLNIPAYLGKMEYAYADKKSGAQDIILRSLITPDLKIPSEEVMNHQSFYMLMGQTLEHDSAHSISFYPQNATEEEQKNFPVLYAGLMTQKDADGAVHFKSRLGDFEGALRPQDILFDFKTGKLVDGTTGEFDTSRTCLERMFDFKRYASKDNPPQKTILTVETPVRETPQETYYPTRAEVNAANLKNKNWEYGGR